MTQNTDSTTQLGAKAPGFSALEWNDELVAALWSFYATTEADNYFAARFGKALLERVKRHLPSGGMAADYGCGSGQLARRLAQHRPVLGVDFGESLAATRAAFEQVPTPFPVTFTTPADIEEHAGTIDALFFLEAIEHLLPDWIGPTFDNLHKLLKPGGVIVCSTPNEEDVARAMVCCPSCRHYFHKYQHMHLFSAASLAAFMEQQGFETLEVKAHNLGMASPYARARQLLRRVMGKAQYPHLVYVGRKR